MAIAEPVRRRHHFTFSELVVEVQHLDDGPGCDSEGVGFMPLHVLAQILDLFFCNIQRQHRRIRKIFGVRTGAVGGALYVDQFADFLDDLAR